MVRWILVAALSAACSSGVGSASTGTGGSTAAGGSGGGGGAPSCAQVCPSVVAAKCTGGPPTESDCESGCQAIRAGKCASAYDALLTCAGTSPQISCDAAGKVTVVGCSSENSALNGCLASP